jgi:hypothetical protein
MHGVVGGDQLGDVNEVTGAGGLAGTRICHTVMLTQAAAFLSRRLVRKAVTSRQASVAVLHPGVPRVRGLAGCTLGARG